jgi:hypothetical protein
MAATMQPLASQIAIDVLKKGGTAVDAAIAANAALGLMEPVSCGVGGDLFAIVWDPKTKHLYGYNGSGRSPKGRTLADMRRKLGGRSYVQPITKPITADVVDYQGNALANTVFFSGSTVPVTVDYTTGIVSGLGVGELVDFQYHYPVRFDVDNLDMQVEESNTRDGQPIVSINSIQLIELLPPNY